MGYRNIEFRPEVTEVFDGLVRKVGEEFDRPVEERPAACRELLADIYFPGGGGYDALAARPDLPVASRATLLQLDPDNITIEHEHYTDIDPEKYAAIKPLVWFWIMFDRSPLGRNVALGTRVRGELAKRVFESCGERVKIFHDVEFTWGYNLSVGDDAVLHRNVFLDDRGGLELGRKVSVSDYANIYTHTHDVEDISDVTCYKTTLGEGVRITYHATVLAGASVGANGLVAACGLATRSVPDNWVWGGVPAKPLKEKTSRLGETEAESGGCC